VKPFDRAELRAYLDRPWRELALATAENRAEAYRRDPERSWRVSGALRAAVVAANPDWPTEADRDADFAHHLRMCALLDRVAHVFIDQTKKKPTKKVRRRKRP